MSQQPLPTILSQNYYHWSTSSTYLMLFMTITSITTLTNTPTTATNNPQLELLPPVHPLNIFDALDGNNNEMTTATT